MGLEAAAVFGHFKVVKANEDRHGPWDFRVVLRRGRQERAKPCSIRSATYDFSSRMASARCKLAGSGTLYRKTEGLASTCPSCTHEAQFFALVESDVRSRLRDGCFTPILSWHYSSCFKRRIRTLLQPRSFNMEDKWKRFAHKTGSLLPGIYNDSLSNSFRLRHALYNTLIRFVAPFSPFRPFVCNHWPGRNAGMKTPV